jgi:hypothetical protein
MHSLLLLLLFNKQKRFQRMQKIIIGLSSYVGYNPRGDINSKIQIF